MRLTLLLLLAGSVGLVGSAQARPSTYSRSQGGAKALYLLLDDLGYRPARVFSVGELDGKEHVLALLGQASDNEKEHLLKQVRKGGLLILALPLFDEEGYCGDTRFGSFKIKRQLRSQSQQRKTRRRAGEPRSRAERGAQKTRHPELKIRASVCEMRVPDGGHLLAGTEKGAVAMELPAGQGKLLVLAHEDLLVNLNLNRDDLVVLVRHWLSDNAPARGRVVFLENRTGGGGGASVVSMLRKAGLSIFLLHGLIFLLLLYWSQTPRFGDPTDVFVQTRREFSQHAHALGHLYQHRRASVHALRQQYERFLDWLVGKPEMAMVGMGGGAAGAVQRRALRGNRGAIAALIATRTGRDPASVESLLAQIEYTVGPARTVGEPRSRAERSAPDQTGPSDARDVQRHYRLGQALAALQHSTGAAQRGTGDKRGRSKIH